MTASDYLQPVTWFCLLYIKSFVNEKSCKSITSYKWSRLEPSINNTGRKILDNYYEIHNVIVECPSSNLTLREKCQKY